MAQLFNWASVTFMLALIAAFPPVFFTAVTTNEGLRISLGLFLFYTLRGLVAMVSLSRYRSTQSVIFLRTNQLLQLAEVPLFFGIIWSSLKVIPSCPLVTLYEYLLLGLGPLFTILEGVAAMECILEIDPVYGESITELNNVGKVCLLLICMFGHALAFGIIGWIVQGHLMQGTLSVFSAASVAVLCTLLLVLTFVTLVSEHALITDSTLLALYLSYNVGWIGSEWTKQRKANWFKSDAYTWFMHLIARVLPEEWLSLLSVTQTVHSLVWLGAPLTSIHSMLRTLLSLIAPSIIIHVSVQVALFVLAARLFGQANAIDSDEDGEDSVGLSVTLLESAQDWLFNIFWPCFGRSLLILLYTHTWLLQIKRSDILAVSPYNLLLEGKGSLAYRLATNPNIARWCNVVVCLLIYVKYLMIKPDTESDDNARWRNILVGLKED